jgi:hypothetical protein
MLGICLCALKAERLLCNRTRSMISPNRNLILPLLYIHQRWWLFPIWVVPPALFGAVGYILHESQVEEYTRNFWLGFTVVFGCLALGYLVSEALYSWYTKLDRQNVFHEALVLTGNARSAESYLIRLQANSHISEKNSSKRISKPSKRLAKNLGLATRAFRTSFPSLRLGILRQRDCKLNLCLPIYLMRERFPGTANLLLLGCAPKTLMNMWGKSI